MPQNTPMKRQFTTIDGRTVMSNLPQHWGGNDWKITGVDNPLPVGNYVQTESGVWIPQKGSDDGAADVRLTGSIVEVDISKHFSVIPAGTEVVALIDTNDAGGGFKEAWIIAIRESGTISKISIQPRLDYQIFEFFIEDVFNSSGSGDAVVKTDIFPLPSRRFRIRITAGDVDDFKPRGMTLFLRR